MTGSTTLERGAGDDSLAGWLLDVVFNSAVLAVVVPLVLGIL